VGARPPTWGAVEVLGGQMPPDRYHLLHRMNFESPYVEMPHRLSIRQNLKIFGKLYGVRNIAGRIAQLADELDLADLLDRPAGKLYAGQKTRGAISKAPTNR